MSANDWRDAGMSAKHSPAPWVYLPHGTFGADFGASMVDTRSGSMAIDCTSSGKTREECDANARLIAAAPRMAAALQRAAHLLAELPEQSPQMLALRSEIVECIKQATPEHYGSAS